jgi:TRAP transporter TAXI family solute receptor
MARAVGDNSGRDERGNGRRRRRIIALAAMLLLGLAASPVAGAAIDELTIFRIGTAATTGTYFQIGGILASAISKPSGSRDCDHGGSCGVPGLVAVAQASQGSIQNVLAVSGGQLESALAQADIAHWAYTGGVPAARRCTGKEDVSARSSVGTQLKTRGPLKNLRAIAGLYPEDIHVVVRADSAIRSLRDLKGKRVALGEPESGTVIDARLVIEAAGLSECDMKPEYLRLSEAADALVQGRIDAFFLVGGYPVPAITDVSTAVPTRLVPIPRDIAERLSRKYAFYGTDVIPAGSYPGVDEDTATVSIMAVWLVREEIDDNLVYAITKALWRDTTKRLLDTSHPMGRRIRLANAFDGIGIPLHPGAIRFYREAGLRLPDGL